MKYLTAEEARELNPKVDLDSIMEAIEDIATSVSYRNNELRWFNLEQLQVEALKSLGYEVSLEIIDPCGDSRYIISW